jgi:hypothetical protein
VTTSIVFFAGAVALSTLWIGGSRTRTNSRPLDDDSCSSAAAIGEASRITFRVDVPPRVTAGQPIPITLTLVNHGDRGAQINYGGYAGPLSRMPFDVRITRASDSATVWHRLEGVLIGDVGSTDTLASGDSLKFVDRWTQKLRNGQFVTPGIYCIRGAIFASGVRVNSEPAGNPPRKGWLTSDAVSIEIVPSDK